MPKNRAGNPVQIDFAQTIEERALCYLQARAEYVPVSNVAEYLGAPEGETRDLLSSLYFQARHDMQRRVISVDDVRYAIFIAAR